MNGFDKWLRLAKNGVQLCTHPVDRFINSANRNIFIKQHKKTITMHRPRRIADQGVKQPEFIFRQVYLDVAM